MSLSDEQRAALRKHAAKLARNTYYRPVRPLPQVEQTPAPPYAFNEAVLGRVGRWVTVVR